MRSVVLVGLLGVMAAAPGTVLAAAVVWDETYEGDVLPNAASPAWSHETANGTSQILSGDYLQLLDAESWRLDNDTYMQGNPVTFIYNNPEDGQDTWQQLTYPCFTIEWRMKINYVKSGTSPADAEVGIDFAYAGYLFQNASFEWYYDVDNQRLVNNRWASYNYEHAGKTGPEGSETDLTYDVFPNIGLGEWHTYRVTSAKIGDNLWHRELWLDGQYVGRWWNEKPAFGDPYLRMLAAQDLSPDSDVEFDYVRWADEPGGQFIRRFSADLDGDDDVDQDDFNTLDGCFGESGPPWAPASCELADINSDGVVDCGDFQLMVDNWTGPPPLEDILGYENCPCVGRSGADQDCDGDVDQTDYDTVTACFGQDPTGTCARADIDGDGDIDCVDFGLLVEEWTGPPQDPPAFGQCPQIDCALVNGGFEDGWTNWINNGGDVVCGATFCGFRSAFGDCFARAARNNVPFGESSQLASADHPGWTLARIVDVTNPGGLTLDVQFSCYYLLSAAYGTPPDYSDATAIPDRIHQVWDIGYRRDGQDPTGPDDGCLVWTELANYDGSESMWGNIWCAAEWVYLPPVQVQITDMVACPSKVILRMRSWADLPLPGGDWWYFSHVDNVEVCVTGQGGVCPGPGDLDEDGDVDGADQSLLEGCYSGPGVELTCGTPRADLDADNDVDCADFARFDELRPGGADAWATCPDLTCPNVVQNGGFDSGDLDPWVATGGGVLEGCGQCGFVPVRGDNFFGAWASNETMDFTLAQIVPVTNPGGTTLTCELSLYYLLSSQDGTEVSPGNKQPGNVHQHWKLGYRPDGHFPESVDDPQLQWVELVPAYDGTTSMALVDTASGDTYCDAGWVRLDEQIGPIQVNLNPGVCLKSVVLRMHGTADSPVWQSVNLVDEVYFCVAGDGTTCINPGDLDQDGDVDDDDVTLFDSCMDDYEVSGQVPTDPPCSLADLDGDDDIDCDDYATLLYWYDQPWPPQESTNCPCADNGPGDLDCDGDVDQDDVNQFQSCLGNPPVPDKYHPGCGRADIDEDGDVDCWDFSLLRSYWTEGGTPPGIPECSCALTNGGFETGAWTPWEHSGSPEEPQIYSQATDPCSVAAPEGTYFAGKATEGIPMDIYIGRIVDVTEPGGDVLNVAAEAYYRINGVDYVGGYSHATEVRQVWEIGYNSDGSDPTNINDADTWVTLADLDGTLTAGRYNAKCDPTDSWAHHGPVIKQISLSGALVTKVIFRVHMFTTRTNEWNVNYIDDVQVCVFGLGGPYVASTDPPKGSAVASLPQISVTFNDTVTGVDAGDLTVNGSPATSLTGSGAGPYVFSGYDAPEPGTITVVLASGGIQDSQGRAFAGDTWTYLDICDFDRDGDVDSNDLNVLTDCYSGPGGGVSGQSGDVPCERSDVDSDLDVDLIDFATFQAHYTG